MGTVTMGPLIRTILDPSDSVAALTRAKGDTTVAVCLPARDEADTIGGIVRSVRTLVDAGLVDDLVVIDDHSTDATAERAAAEGARVVRAADVRPDPGGNGKGRALWRSLHETDADLVLWCDADIRNFDVHFVTRLLAPLLTDPDIQFVKGFYRRPTGESGQGGGRVTELTARPAIALLHPRIADVIQPLSGEYGGRRSLLERLPFVAGYGVELGLLIDIVDRVGTDAIAQVDLGTRLHRNRSLADLGPQATTILQVALRRVDPALVPVTVVLDRPEHGPIEVSAEELPPLLDVASYRYGPASRTTPRRS
jgi:glucosyl-3-phosphoglycerate synthase